MTMRTIRPATPDDAAAVHRIYAPIVEETAISFEYEVPSESEIRRRIEHVLTEGFPWLVAATEDGIVGYAYGSRFRTRRAYDWAAEVSVYVDADARGRGVGRRLYERLMRILELQGFRSAYGVATAGNPSSEALHRALGFAEVGRLPRVGYKLGAWHDVIYWHLGLGSPDRAPTEIRRAEEVLRAEEGRSV